MMMILGRREVFLRGGISRNYQKKQKEERHSKEMEENVKWSLWFEFKGARQILLGIKLACYVEGSVDYSAREKSPGY